jgi:hypothetical protein
VPGPPGEKVDWANGCPVLRPMTHPLLEGAKGRPPGILRGRNPGRVGFGIAIRVGASAGEAGFHGDSEEGVAKLGWMFLIPEESVVRVGADGDRQAGFGNVNEPEVC